MFRKAPNLSSQSPIKSSARRALAQEVAESLHVSLEDVKAVLPEGLRQAKGTTSAGEPFTLFSAPEDSEPLLFRLGKGEAGLLIPTIYMLARLPDLSKLPYLVTNDMVLEKLLGGADLMRPGITKASLRDLPDDIPKDGLVAIGTSSMPEAIKAVGLLSFSSADLKRTSTGKAVEVLHVEGDTLWALGSKKTAQLQSKQELNPVLAPDAVPDDLAGAVSGLSVDALEGEDIALSQADVDSLLQDALLYAISQKLSKDSQALPITSSKLFDTYILPSRRAAASSHDVSIRKSSFKNASAFLKQAKKDGLISTKEAKGGDLSITAVNAQHPLLKDFKAYKTVADLQRQERKREERDEQSHAKSSQRSVSVAQLYKPHGQSVSLCTALGFAKDAYALPTEIRTAINDYIVKHSLVNPHDQSYISLNDELSDAILKKGEQLDFMPRSLVADRLLSNMQAWHRVTIREAGQEEEFLHKGLASSIDISVKKRQGKKLVTIIEGLEPFLISPQRFAEDMQVKCASSSTTNELQQSTAKKPLHEVVVQGNQIPICSKELIEHYGVPKQSIAVHK